MQIVDEVSRNRAWTSWLRRPEDCSCTACSVRAQTRDVSRMIAFAPDRLLERLERRLLGAFRDPEEIALGNGSNAGVVTTAPSAEAATSSSRDDSADVIVPEGNSSRVLEPATPIPSLPTALQHAIMSRISGTISFLMAPTVDLWVCDSIRRQCVERGRSFSTINYLTPADARRSRLRAAPLYPGREYPLRPGRIAEE